jgi:hypothetical protein
MPANSKNNVRVKALSFINKVSGFLIKNLEPDRPASDTESSAYDKKENPIKEEPDYSEFEATDENGFELNLRSSIISKLGYDIPAKKPESPSSPVSEELMKSLAVPKNSVEKKRAPELTPDKNTAAGGLNKVLAEQQNQNIVKMKADTFRQKITGSGTKKEPEKMPAVPVKDHRIFINSKIARDLGLYEKFYDIESHKKAKPAPPGKKRETAREVVAEKKPEIPAPEAPVPEKKNRPVTHPSEILHIQELADVDFEDTGPIGAELSNKLCVYENGEILDIKLGESRRSQVIETMKLLSNIWFDIGCKDAVLDYEDLSMKIYFDDWGVVKEFELNNNFPGTTSKGLRVGEPLDNALKLYGTPVIRLENQLIWKTMEVIFSDSVINSIKIGGPDIYINAEKKHLVRNFKIYTEGFLIGIIVGESTDSVIVGGHNKEHATALLKNYSNSIVDPRKCGSKVIYDDIDILIYFDESDIVYSIEFGENFIGSTVKGLSIGDPVEKAINLYGEPDIKNDDFMSWNKLKIYYRNNKVNSIRIHK